MSTAPPGPTVPPVPAEHPPPPERPELPDGAEPSPTDPGWRAWTAWVALVAGFAAAIVGALVLSIAGAAFGAPIDKPPPAVNILATFVQDLCLIGAAVLMARIAGTPRRADFGLRATRFWPAAGWTALAWGTFVAFTAAWVALIGARDAQDGLPKELGADESTMALVAVGVLVCVVAPIAEELFFRGYFFTALRSWRGVWPAAAITGIVFGGIHAGGSDPAFLLPLAFFGFALCLLYVRTRSLYPAVVAHAVNNSVAFGSSQHWGWEIAPTLLISLALIALVFRLVATLGDGRRAAARGVHAAH